jgi:UPF0755 protein
MKLRAVLLAVALASSGCMVFDTLGLNDGALSEFAKQAFKSDKSSGGKDAVHVVIPKGSGPQKIAKILEDSGVIGDSGLFYRWLKYVAKKQSALKAGEYDLSPTMTPEQIVALLEVGKPPEVKFTIPEGLRKEEVAEIIANAGFGKKDDILAVMNDAKIVSAFGVPSTGADGQSSVPGGIEGYLFPDTYQFPKGAPPEKIIKKMRARLDEVFDEKMKSRMSEMGWNLHKVLTLAAIVEKETGAKEERPHISAVFQNRMKRGMKMQTDPTVIYGTPNYDGHIYQRDLDRVTPYNTYVIPGLPPGPIAQPGLESIKAVLWPTEGSRDLYFVAKGDSGQHQFCPTLECHNAAVARWQGTRGAMVNHAESP